MLHQVRREGPITEVREALLLWRTRADFASGAGFTGAGRGIRNRAPDSAPAAWVLCRGSAGGRGGRPRARCGGACPLRRQDSAFSDVAEAALEELADALGGAGVPADTLRFALTHWLQNATNAPLSLGHESVEAFCRKHELSAEQVRAAADDLDLNLALLDDLLEAAARDEGD